MSLTVLRLVLETAGLNTQMPAVVVLKEFVNGQIYLVLQSFL